MPANQLTKADVLRLATPVFQQYGIMRAGIFGSFARGEQHESSDIDFLVEFNGRTSLFLLGQLKDDLEQALQTPCDVLTYSSVEQDKGALAEIIRNESEAIYEH